MTGSWSQFDAGLASLHVNPSASGTVAPLTQGQIRAFGTAILDGVLAQVLLAVANINIGDGTLGQAFPQLQQWANTLEQDAANALATAEGASTTATNANTTANTALGNWSTLLSGLGLPSQTVDALVTWLANIQSDANAANTNITDFLKTGNWSDLSAAFSDYCQLLVGNSSATGVLSTVPAPTVTAANTTAQPLANFPNAASVASSNGWVWDSSISYGGSGGSVTFTAAGVLGALVGIVAPAQPGQTATLASQVQWSGLTAASGTSPILLQVIPGYVAPGTTSFVPGTPVTLDSVAAGPSSSSWVALSGSYTVPSDGSVNAVQMRLVVTSDATAGSVTWAACTDTISGGFLPTMQSDLSALQSDSSASTAAFSALVTSVESAITGYTNWSTFIAAVDSAWSTYSTTEAQIGASESFTIQQFFDALLGLNSSGQVSGSNVSSSTGLASLEADWNAWVAPFQSAATTLETDVTTTWNQWVSGLQNMLGISTASDLATTENPTTQVASAALPGVSSPTLGQSLQSTWDGWVNSIASALGLGGTSPSGNSLSTATTAVAAMASTTATAHSLSVSSTQSLAALAANPAATQALQPNSLANMPMSNLTAPYADQKLSLGGIVRCPTAATYEQVAFMAYYNAPSVSGTYLNFYRLSGGTLEWLFSSDDVSSMLSSTPAWVVYTFSASDAITVAPGDLIVFEVQSNLSGIGGGGYANAVFILGALATPSSVPTRPGADVPNIGITRAPTTAPPTGNINASGFSYSPSAPYFALEQVSVPPGYQPPTLAYYPDSTTVTVAPGYNKVDVIACGAGGGGGGGVNGGGYGGGATVVTVGSTTVTATGGNGAPGGDSSGITEDYGQSPGSITFNGQTYTGGAQCYIASPGNAPGGGGGGGYWGGLFAWGGNPGQFATQTVPLDSSVTTIGITVGQGGAENTYGGSPSYGAGPGAAGGVWLRFYQ